MKPEDRHPTNRFQNPRTTGRDSSSFVPPRDQYTSSQVHPQQQAAANIVREKINDLYDQVATEQSIEQASPAETSNTQPNTIHQQDLEINNPYERTHTNTSRTEPEHWKEYHTAWQSYYQKYYERYYVSKVQEATTKLQTGPANSSAPAEPTNSQLTATRQQSDAVYELRQKLRQKVHKSAKKARSSHHFIPIVAAVVVVLLFAFLQYNRVLISNVKAYVSPGAIDPQNLVIDPTASVEVGPEPKLIIPKINVDVPTVYGIGADNDSQMAAMEEGVAHFSIPGASSTPGQIGNTVLSGHSSNDLFDRGDYKFIFAQLDRLSTGDMIYANYEGIRYSYTVTKKEVVMPSEVNKLIYDTDQPVMTLITCTPLGTAEKRLLVTAEQISPSPAEARPAPSGSGTEPAGTNILPSNSPTLTQRLFGR